jgi:hypothetical protein
MNEEEVVAHESSTTESMASLVCTSSFWKPNALCVLSRSSTSVWKLPTTGMPSSRPASVNMLEKPSDTTCRI